MAPTNRGRAVISYAHEDAHFCQLLYNALTAAGVDTWYDRSGQAGQLFPKIEQEIERSPLFLVILTVNALTSNAVRHEIEHAQWCDIDDFNRLTLPIVFSLSGKDDPRLGDSSLRAFRNLFKNRCVMAAPDALTDDKVAQDVIAEVLRSLQVAEPTTTTGLLGEPSDDLIYSGRVSNALGDVRRTHLLFEKATELAPNLFDAWVGLGMSQFQMGRYDSALYAAAKTSFDHALGLVDGKSLIAWMGKGDALYALGMYDRALVAYQKAIELDPQRAIAWSGKGATLRKLKRFDDAKTALMEARRLSPNNVDIICNYGILLLDMASDEDAHQHRDVARQHFEAARFLYDTALRNHPDNAELWCGKADALFGMQEYQKARTAYSKARDCNPADAKIWRYLGDACYESQDYQSALDAYDQALQLSPNDVVAALNGKGNAQRHLDQWAAAAQTYQRALALPSDDVTKASLWANLAKAYDGDGKPREAANARAKAEALERQLATTQ